MEIPRQIITTWGVMVVVWNPIARAADPPRPTPTPRPGTLAALARSTSLSHKGAAPIVLTNDNLTELSGGAVVTLLAPSVQEPAATTPPAPTDPKRRSFWRKKVLAQSRRIATLEEMRDAVREEINNLERGRMTARTLARIDMTRSRLREIDEEIRSEKSKLSRIVREARKEGAQPGWFR